QQFFEALGLTPAPKVAISRKEVMFRARPGQSLQETLEVKSEEKRACYAHGVSSQPWLEVGRAQLHGRVAMIPIGVPAVPNRPGETLKAWLTVQANGNQRFNVPVTVEVQGPPVEAVFPIEEGATIEEVLPIDMAVPSLASPVAPLPAGSFAAPPEAP